jgi:maleate cis-trans isomerase
MAEQTGWRGTSKGNANWRGTIGYIAPTLRAGTEGGASLLPPGIGIISTYLGAREGSVGEFQSVVAAIEARIKEFAELGVDLVHQGGAPPMVVQGYQREQELVADWEARYGVPVVTTTRTQVEAMKALGMKRIVGLTYFPDDFNQLTAKYFSDAGFEVLAIEGIGSFHEAHHIGPWQVYRAAKDLFIEHEPADGIYLLGGGWRIDDMVEPLEGDLEVPVLHPGAARSWYLQRRLRVRVPRAGLGRLLAEFPPLP